MMPLKSLICLLRAAALQRSMAHAFGRPHRQTSDGGRRVARPLALAQTGRTPRYCQQTRGNLHEFPRRRLCAPGTLASPAVRLPRIAVDPGVWPLQKKKVYRIIITLAFVIEDMRTACAELRARGYMCDRITHTEVMTSTGTQYLGALLFGDHQLLWVATPADWYVRLPGKR
eukprot:4799189-Pyramimonas_sp.AAC.1